MSDELNAKRYEWLREHYRFANDSMCELWFDATLEPEDGEGDPEELDRSIDKEMAQVVIKVDC